MLTTGTPPASDAPGFLDFFLHLYLVEQRRPAWERLGEAITAAWIAEHAGTRPHAWWAFSAPRDTSLMAGTYWANHYPIQRQKVRGAGRPAWGGNSIVPRMAWGVALQWIDTDPAAPIFVESEATYLERHGLLEPAELHRLRAADKRPVPLAEILREVPR